MPFFTSQAELDTLTEKVANLESKLALEHETRIRVESESQKTVSHLRREITDLTAAKAGLQGEVDNLRSETVRLRTVNNAFRETLVKAETSQSEYKEKLVLCERALHEELKSNQTLRDAHDKLLTEYTQVVTQRNTLEAEQRRIRAQNEEQLQALVREKKALEERLTRNG